jgi:hypothetical protein
LNFEKVLSAVKVGPSARRNMLRLVVVELPAARLLVIEI